MATLPVDFLDDILNASMNGKRKYRITHADGSTEEVILEDVSEYDQVGSNFGAAQVNQTNEAVNEKLESADVVDPMVATEEGFAADAKLTGDALSELNKNLHFIREYKSVKIENLGVGETNYDVRCQYDTPDGYVIAATECYSSAGCSASYGGYSETELIASVTNNTTITRSPYVSWNVLFVKKELMEYRS